MITSYKGCCSLWHRSLICSNSLWSLWKELSATFVICGLCGKHLVPLVWSKMRATIFCTQGNEFSSAHRVRITFRFSPKNCHGARRGRNSICCPSLDVFTTVLLSLVVNQELFRDHIGGFVDQWNGQSPELCCPLSLSRVYKSTCR